MRGYDHQKIEKKWQAFWEKKKIYTTPDKAPGKDNFYLLVEFPYPSGNLHVGHWYAFALPDILARYQRMQGKNVLYPIGFDAFGLPAENAAIKNKINPRKWTEKNIEYMTKQIRSMGAFFDWSRAVKTIDPEYYRWTQWMFLLFYKKGLAYRKETAVNWCPTDKTVLANEQVIDGKCDRCSSEVIQKQMLQWNIKITEYADRLIDDLEKLDWPEQIKDSQRNWIGRSEGAEIDFPIVEKDVKRVVLLHGREATSNSLWHPWLKAKLEGLGYEVQVPNLPHAEEPNDEEQTDYALANCTFDEQTAIVGHSFGGVVALRLLEAGVKVQRTVLVATPYSGTYLDKKVRASVTKALKKGFDFEKIKVQSSFALLYDTGDKVVPMSDGEAYEKQLGAYLMRGKGIEPHFSGIQEPDVFAMSVPIVRVFTTRADTLFGGTYLVLAPEHAFVAAALRGEGPFAGITNTDEIGSYVARAQKKTELQRQEDLEKTGVELKGVKARNPATGEEIPVWIGDFVIGSYGTGAVFADAHDQRDFEFANKYGIRLKETLQPLAIKTAGPDAIRDGMPFVPRRAVIAIIQHPTEEKYLAVTFRPTNTHGFISGGLEGNENPIEAAIREIREESGFTAVSHVRSLGGPIQSRFYSVKYSRNSATEYVPHLFKLESLERVEIAPEEAAEHHMEWMTEEQIESFINRMDYRAAWNRLKGRAYTGKGILYDSAEFSGLTSDEALPKIGEKYGRLVKQYHLRDWIVSRQRYWGVPIPIIHCAKCGAQPVPDKELPVKLPEVKDYLPEGSGKSPLAKAKKWVLVKCPKCKGKAERETDTLDTFVDSSWYFLRYTDPKNNKKFADPKKMNNWLPVDLYSGGAEHTTMHLLYSRFWHKALFDLGLVGDSEPYAKRMNRSLILGPDGQKMSKSRGNVIDPDGVVERLGSDTVRMYLAFIGPYNEVGSYPWNPDGVVGIRRFLERVYRASEFVTEDDDSELESLLHRTIKKVGDDIEALKFNTAISQLMIFMNEVEKRRAVGGTLWRAFLKLLTPFAPHLAEELWADTGHKSSIHGERWPQYEPKKVLVPTLKIAVQINGKTRAETEVPSGSNDVETEKAARLVVQNRLKDLEISRVIVIPGRLVNFVIKAS